MYAEGLRVRERMQYHSTARSMAAQLNASKWDAGIRTPTATPAVNGSDNLTISPCGAIVLDFIVAKLAIILYLCQDFIIFFTK